MVRAAHGYPIVLSDLSLEYPPHGPSPAHVALHGLTLTIAPGEVLGVLGSAGAARARSRRCSPARRSSPAAVRCARSSPAARQPCSANGCGGCRSEAGRVPLPCRVPAAGRLVDAAARSHRRRDHRRAHPRTRPRYNRRALTMRVATMLDAVRLPLSLLERFPTSSAAVNGSGSRSRVRSCSGRRC